jgi:hypothetical protein
MRFVVTRDGLEPFDAEACEFLENQHDGEPLEMEALKERNMRYFRLIMGQIGDVAKALHMTPEQLRAELLVATDNFTLLGDALGTPVVAVNSMSRHHMNDHDLHVFWTEAKEVIRTKLLDRVPDTAERERLAEMLSLQPA